MTAIHQDDKGVTVTYRTRRQAAAPRQASADWCVCTIPLSILSQIDDERRRADAGGDRRGALRRLGQDRAAVQAPLLGGGRARSTAASRYTDLPIAQISYPSTDYHKAGKGVLLGAYSFGLPATEFTAMTPGGAHRAARSRHGAQIHPQYREEFENGVSVAWHRVPWTLGCFGLWTDATPQGPLPEPVRHRRPHRARRRARLLLPAWQEGAVLSSLDAITRLHKRVVAG